MLLFLTIFSLILISPWIIFLHKSLGEYKVTTTGGVNFLVGTGYYSFGMADHIDTAVLPLKYIASNNNFHQTSNGPSALSIDDENLLLHAHNTLQVDDISMQIAKKIWHNKTNEQIINGCLKVLHSLGFSLRGWNDYFGVLFFVVVIICSIFCVYKKVYKEIICFHWLVAFCGFCMAFIWLPNIRFKTFYFDSSALLVIATVISMLIDQFRKSTIQIHSFNE